MADSILLIPAPEYREALLGDSPWGGRVPAAFVAPGLTPHLVSHAIGDLHLGSSIALVLRWRGVDDPMGCDRAASVCSDVEMRDGRQAVVNDCASRADLMARWASALGLGRVIRLDADGREVTP